MTITPHAITDGIIIPVLDAPVYNPRTSYLEFLQAEADLEHKYRNKVKDDRYGFERRKIGTGIYIWWAAIDDMLRKNNLGSLAYPAAGYFGEDLPDPDELRSNILFFHKMQAPVRVEADRDLGTVHLRLGESMPRS